MLKSTLNSIVAMACLSAGMAWGCGVAAPVKMVLKGDVLTADKVSEQLKSRLPCRQESSALACMCRPAASAVIEVTVGFRWKDARMSGVSERRLKELGDGLRSIEGYGGSTVKMVPVKTAEKPKRATLLQRRNGVSEMVALASAAGKPAVSSGQDSGGSASTKVRWVRQKYLINAVFV